MSSTTPKARTARKVHKEPVKDAKLPIENLDLTAKRNEYLIGAPSFIENMLVKVMSTRKDLPLVYTQLNIAFFVIPAAVSLFFIPRDLWGGYGKPALCTAYLAFTMFMFLQRFVLMLHFNAHRTVWTGLFRPMNKFNEIVLAPFFGIPSGQYYLHHVVMHHIENNVFPYDVSSTEPYQRDSWLDYLKYWFKFYGMGQIELPIYALKRRRYGLALYSTVCAAWHVFVNVKLYHIDPMATWFVLILPFILCSFALTFGNWSQHIFIDPSRPESNFALTYNCMNTFENQLTFNDGYHIVHHMNSRLHWTELPTYFCNNLGRFAAEDAFIFTGVGFFDVGMYVMTGQLRKLAKHYVSYGQIKRSEDEIVAEFKRRLTPILRS